MTITTILLLLLLLLLMMMMMKMAVISAYAIETTRILIKNHLSFIILRYKKNFLRRTEQKQKSITFGKTMLLLTIET